MQQVFFGATIGKAIFQAVYADSGVHVNLMDGRLFQMLVDLETNFEKEQLSKLAIYEMAAENENGSAVTIKCDKEIKRDMHIQHGTSLMLRNVSRAATAQAVIEPL